MKKFTLLMVVSMMFACSGDDNNAKKNNGQTNNNGTTSPNNGTTAPNNGTTIGPNNGTTGGNNNSTGATTSGDLCLDKTCENPAASCDADVAVTYSDASTCDAATGDCVNGTEVRVDCAATNQACDNGVCVDTCQAADPCDAPADSCAGTMLTAYTGPGMCDVVAGVCSYAAVVETTDCDVAKQVCQVDKCVDLCATETCDAPAGFCTNDTATSYSGNGTCAYLDGTCDYAAVEVVTDCTLGGQTCLDGACIGGTPVAPVLGDLVITEIMPDSDVVTDQFGEWFEIKNVALTPILLNDLILSDDGTNTHTITSATDLIVNPGQYFIFGRSADMTPDPMTAIPKNGGVVVDYEYATFSLSNSGGGVIDEVIITTSGGVEIDRVDYSKAMGFGRGVSMQVGNQHDLKVVNNNDEQFWCSSTGTFGAGDYGTPGTANSDCLPPAVVTIYDIQDATQANHPAVNTDVDVKGVVVTAKNGSYVWAQEVGGGAYSGIHLQTNGAPGATALNVGDTFDFIGTYIELGDHSQIALISINVTAAGATTTPEVVDSALLAIPTEAEKWEGVLIQINEAGVTQQNPDEPANYKEFLVDGAIRIDDRLFNAGQPAACTFFDKIVGPLYYANGDFKILPRNGADAVVSMTPVVDATGPMDNHSISILGVGNGVENSGYSPKILCVTANTPILFTNDDSIRHDAVSRDPSKAAPNNFRPVNKLLPSLLDPMGQYVAGIVAESTEHFRCSPHSNMEGVIIVVPMP